MFVVSAAIRLGDQQLQVAAQDLVGRVAEDLLRGRVERLDRPGSSMVMIPSTMWSTIDRIRSFGLPQFSSADYRSVMSSTVPV